MSVLYGTSFQYPDVQLRKNQDLVDSNPHSYYDNQQQNQYSSGLMRYRSAPSSLFDTLVNGSNVGGGGVGGTGGGEDYRFLRSSSPEIDTILERFMSPSGNSSGGSDPHDVPAAAIKQEMTEPALVFQRNFQLENSGSVNSGSALDRPTKMGCSGYGSNLARQSSSPADFFSHLGVENGFSVTRDSGSYKLCGEASPQSSRLSNQLSCSSGPRYLAQISETADENAGATSPDGTSQNRKRQYMPDFQNDTWDDSSFNSLTRSRENDSNMFSVFNDLEHQDVNPAIRMTGLTHHLSLPKTVAEMATAEKFLQFQSSVPCKIRAKRGFATHPRSIAERVRRTRISERMRKLQELFPNMDKQTNTADMLELAVESIKDLQSQVKALSDTKARCKCSSIHKPYSSASSA